MSVITSAPVEEVVREPESTPFQTPVRPAAWRNAWPYLALAILACIAAFTNVANAPAFQDDEGTYTFQAHAIWDGALAPYTYWYDHPPFGWMQLAALGWLPDMLGLGGSAVGAMRYVVAGYLVANALLVYAVGRRLGLQQVFAGMASYFFVLSPLSLELGRQVFLDNIAMPWILGAFYFALSPKRNLAAAVASGVLFAGGVLSKETMAIAGPALLYALWRNTHHTTRSFAIPGFLTVGGLVLAYYPLMALLKGELLPTDGRATLVDALAFQLINREGSGYLWTPDGTKAGLISGWAFFDGYLLYGGVLGALACLFVPRLRWVGVVVASFALPVVASDGYLPAMYIVAVLPFMALAIGAATDQAWRLITSGLDAYPKSQLVGQTIFLAAVAFTLYNVFTPQWQNFNSDTLSQDKNGEWVETVEWVKAELPRDAVIAVPPSMWQDLRDAGWPDQWTVISAEKVDLDPVSMAEVYPEGWRALDYVVLNPTVRANLDYLQLTELQKAVDAGTPVATIGSTEILKIGE